MSDVEEGFETGTIAKVYDTMPERKDDGITAYFNHIKVLMNNIQDKDYDVICNKCKSNSWFNITRRSSFRLTANCSICGNKQLIIRKPSELFVQKGMK